MAHALGECDHAGGVEAHAVDGSGRQHRGRVRELPHRTADPEHGREVGRDLDLQHRINHRLARVGDGDPFVEAGLDEADASHAKSAGLQLEGRRGVVVERPDRGRFDPVDQDAELREDPRVAVPQAVASELRRPHPSVVRRDREEAVALEHHPL